MGYTPPNPVLRLTIYDRRCGGLPYHYDLDLIGDLPLGERADYAQDILRRAGLLGEDEYFTLAGPLSEAAQSTCMGSGHGRAHATNRETLRREAGIPETPVVAARRQAQREANPPLSVNAKLDRILELLES
jgi:hypothetical protein